MALVEIKSIWFDEMPWSWAELRGIIRKNVYDPPAQRFDFTIGPTTYKFSGGPTVNGYMVYSGKSGDTTIVPVEVVRTEPGAGGGPVRVIY